MPSTLPRAMHFTEHGLNFVNPTANMGVKDLGLRLTWADRDVVMRFDTIREADGAWIAAGEAGHGVTVRTTAVPVAGLCAVVLQHQIFNASAHPVIINAATGQFAPSAAVLHGAGNGLGWDLRCCHTDHVRNEHYPHCQMDYPYLRMLPTETQRLGIGEDQAFPALCIQDMQGKHGIVFAAASQDINFPAFELRKAPFVNTGIFDHFVILHDPRQNDGIEIPAGGNVTLDGIFIQLIDDLAVEDVFVDYLNFVAERHPFRGPTTPLLRQAFHCTWNYGVFHDQSEASLLPTARFIAEHLPNIKFFLMDAGYLAGDIDSTFLDRFYPDPNQHFTARKWPRGMRGFTDELRRLGLRPGLWWSPTVSVASALFTDHPDWFLRATDGAVYRIGDSNAFLDYSHPDALAFLDRTLSVILRDWGFDACKMDFWSQNFEDRRVRIQNPGVTAVQSRARFLATVRQHLPPDGVFMSCVATGMGNPFIGQWVDTYRNTIDIGVGAWKEQVNNCLWALPTLGLEGRQTFLLNNDSAGIMAGYPDNENYFRLTWSFMHMGMLETGGRMETWPERFVTAMRKLTDRCDRGYRCHCPDDRAFTGIPLPEVLYVDYPEDSRTARAGIRQSFALFNWTDEPRLIAIRRARLGHAGPVVVENFWTGERETLEEEFICRPLDGRSAVLFDVIG